MASILLHYKNWSQINSDKTEYMDSNFSDDKSGNFRYLGPIINKIERMQMM